jgi:hypothetical protein
MTAAHENAVVRLTDDIPTLWLNRGDVGVVRSIWLSPADYYEVEFRKPGQCPMRTLVRGERLELVEPAHPSASTGRDSRKEHRI